MVHVIWGEHTVNDGRRPVSDVSALLFASHRDGQWATPDTLWHGNGIPLGMVWRPVPDSAGFVHVAFRPGGIDAAMGSVYFRRDGGGWTRRAEFRGVLGQPGLNVDMAAAGDSLLLAVMVYGDPTGGETNHDFNSVFIQRSADHGVSWSPPERVLRAGADRAHYPRVVTTGDGRFHIVWLRDVDGDVLPDLLQHSHSVDGVCWSEPVTINTSLSGMPVDKEVVADDRGGLHLVYRLLPAGLGEGTTRMIYVYWDGRQWSEPVELFEGRTIGQEIGLARDDDGVLHLVVDVEVDGRRGLHYVQGRPTGAP